MPIIRRWYITDKDGKPVEITSNEILNDILSQMNQEEFKRWKDQYRFSPVHSDLGDFHIYYGTIRDIL